MSLARTCSIGTASRRRRAPHRVGVAFWILAASASALAATHAHGATLGGGTGGRPGGTTPPTPLATPTPAPSPGTPIGRPGIDLPPPAKVALPIPCSTPAPIFTTCAPGEHRIDEIATRYFNTTLMRGCGRFIMHEVPGNAEVTSGASGLGSGPIDPFGEQHRHQVPVRADIPEGDGVNQLEGLPDGDRIVDLGPRTAGAWVLALRGCGLDAIDRIEISGGKVTAQVISGDSIKRFIVPLSPPAPPPSRGIAGTAFPGAGHVKAGLPLSTAFVRLTADAGATPATDRKITVRFGTIGSQELKSTVVTVARNGVARGVQPAAVRWEDLVRLRFTGASIGNAALAGPPCAERATVARSTETSLDVDARLFCPRTVTDPETGEVAVVNQPSCSCTPVAYDRLLSIYTELAKQPFSYIKSGGTIAVGPNLDYLGSKPGAIGDSLSQGVYGIAVKPAAQMWAYPHVVVAQMGGTTMSQNLIKAGPGPEDAIKTFLEPKYGPAPNEIFDLAHLVDGSEIPVLELQQDEIVGVLSDDGIALGGSTPTPMHTGISGMDYTNVLRTSGQCLDETQSGLQPVTFFPVSSPEVAYNSGEETPDLASCHCRKGGPKPWPEVQLGLACGTQTPIEILEEQKPTFVFASAAANHFLSCAVHTKARDCVEMDRFLRDSSEVFRRLRRIDSVRGGVVFGVPPLARIAYLSRQTSSPAGLRAFWKRDGEVTAAGQVLDANEEAFMTARIDEANAHLRDLAELNGYAFVDATEAFDRLADDGVPIVDPANGKTLCRARPTFATRTIDRDPALLGFNAGDDAGCGMISLDGVHPNQLGHAIMANEIIRGLDETYGIDIPVLDAGDLFDVWKQDSLNQDPVDMTEFMRQQALAECLGLSVGELAALGITTPVCASTGAFCVESVALLLGGGSVITEECLEAALVDLGIRPGFAKVDRTPAPQWCWGGVDEGRCCFTNADGEHCVNPAP